MVQQSPTPPGDDGALTESPDVAVSYRETLAEVLRVAIPLMISAGTMSFVLFADRTLLLWYDGASMTASMAGGNIFWVLVCLPVGIMSMTGAIVGQHVGAEQRDKVGQFLWQSVWLSFLFVPMFLLVAINAKQFFLATGQPANLIALESTYLQWLMFGALGLVLETALSGFFSGIEKTRVIMWVSIASGVLNILLDVALIFGFGPFPSMGIAGAAAATCVAFWFKAICFAVLILRPANESTYKVVDGLSLDLPVMRNLLFFGLPSGLMYVTEAAGFTAIVLRIGRLGDLPLRATTMAINFNMLAFIPLVGVSIAASVLVGRHLVESGASRAARSAIAAVVFALAYCCVWVSLYLLVPGHLMSLYELQIQDQASLDSIVIATDLLKFVSLFLLLDSVQIVFAGALRGAGDTWFVLFAGLFASVTALAIGIAFEPEQNALEWWWWVIAIWIGLLAVSMTARFAQGSWRNMTMVQR